jgi:hypothetical protein
VRWEIQSERQAGFRSSGHEDFGKEYRFLFYLENKVTRGYIR